MRPGESAPNFDSAGGSLIDRERLWNRLAEMSAIGAQEGGGVTRRSFTGEERAAKDLVISYMEAWRADMRVSQQKIWSCLLYTSPSPRDRQKSRMPSSA